MNMFRRLLIVPMLAIALTIGFTLSGAGRSQTLTAQTPAFTVNHHSDVVPLDVDKLATIAQILQKMESRQSFTVFSNGKTIKWEAGPASLTPVAGDAKAKETARIHAIRRVVLALSVDDPFVLSMDPNGAACACVCASATGGNWSCDPSGCSSKDGTPCG